MDDAYSSAVSDIHGAFDSWLGDFCNTYNTTKEDILIIAGDAGILYYGDNSKREKCVKEYIANLPITLLCVRGNHEDRPQNRIGKTSMIQTYNNFIQGEIYTQPEFPNILYAIDGEEYNIEGRTILTVGGAYSVDKEYRLLRNWYWNPQEELTDSEMDKIIGQCGSTHFNFVITHTCPIEWEPTYLFIYGINQTKVSKRMENFLSKLEKEIKYDKWIFGHYHGDDSDVCGNGKVSMVYNSIIQII